MLKSRRFKRKAVCLGLTATLIAGFAVTFVVPTAANICRELNMAGISLSLDKFSSNNKDSIINSSVSQPAQTATEASVSFLWGASRICTPGGSHRGNGGAGQEESTEEE